MQTQLSLAARRSPARTLAALAAAMFSTLASAQSVPVSFNNSFETGHLVFDPAGAPLVGTNYFAQLLLDTPTGMLTIAGAGSGLFRPSGTSVPGTWSGGTRQLPGLSYDQSAQLEVRVWDVSLFPTFEAAIAAGGVTGTSGLFAYAYSPSAPPSPTDTWLKNLPTIRLVDQPAPPPLVEAISPAVVGEGQAVEILATVSGGTPPLSYLWRLSGGAQVTTRNLELPSELLRPGTVDFDLTVTDSTGRSSPASQFRLEVTNRAPVIRTAIASGALEGQPVAVHSTADYAWPAGAVQARWTLTDGRSVSGLDALLPLLGPGRHTVHLQLDELGLVALYDNLDSVATPAQYHIPTAETGDELVFSRTNQTLHEVSIYCFADLSALTPAERSQAGGRLMLYRNDGPMLPGTSTRMPGTLLYESAPFGLNAGYFLQRFTDLNLLAPDRLTWSVVWTNLPQTAGKNAGLVLGDTQGLPAAGNVGTSQNEYWVRSDTRWELQHFDGFKPVANFASRATALGTEVQARSEIVPVTFEVTNVPPAIVSFAAPAELDLGLNAEFRITATDPGSEPLSYSWDFGDGSRAEAATATHSYDTAGTYIGSVTVRDSFGGEARQSFTVSVAVDRRPVAFVTTPPLVATQDVDYSGPVAVNPPGSGQTISVQALTLPGWLRWESAADGTGKGRLLGRPNNADVGSHMVELVASDGVNQQRLSVTIVVEDVNDDPSVEAPAAVSVPVREGLANIAVFVTDPDPGDSLSLTARSLDTGRLPDDRLVLGGSGSKRTLSILPTVGAGGETLVELEVSDGKASRRATMAVNLTPPPRFQVTVAPSTGGSIVLDPAAESYEQGFPLRITAAPAAGWELRQWLGLPDGPVAAAGLELSWPVASNAALHGDFADIAAPLIQWEGPAPGISDQPVVTLSGKLVDNDRVASARLRLPGGGERPLALADDRFQVPNVALQPGENRFTIEASDSSGNSSTNAITLVYAPGSILLVGQAPDTREGHLAKFPIQLKNSRELAGMTFNLQFRDYVDFLADPAFEPAGLPEGALVTMNATEAGVVRVVIATAGVPIPAGVHDLGQLRLRVRSLLSPRGLQAFVDPELVEVSDATGTPVAGVDGVSGQALLLPRRITGDLNGNDQLDIGDASLLQRLLLGIDPKRTWDTALNDLNRNGAIDSGDVVRIMRTVVGLEHQPATANAGPAWPAARTARRAALPDQVIELTPASLTVPRSGKFEIQVRTPALETGVRGISFRLNYPARFLSLQKTGGFEPGALIPPGAVTMANPAPNLGQLTFSAMSTTRWPVAAGVLATIRFDVSATVPQGWQGRLALNRVAITTDGFALAQPPGPAVEVALTDEQLVPRVSRFRLNDSGALQFDVLANPGTTLVLEGAEDIGAGLRGWRPLATRVHDRLPMFLTPADNGDSAPAFRFFRLRGNSPALAMPAPSGGDGR